MISNVHFRSAYSISPASCRVQCISFFASRMNDSRKSKTNLFKYLEEALKKHLGYDICCMVYTQELIISDTLYETLRQISEVLCSFFFIKSKSKSEKKKKAHCNVHVNKNVCGIRITRHKKTFPQKTPTVIHIMFLNLNLFHVVDKKKNKES